MSAIAIEYQPMTTVLLYGQLRQFGRSFRLSVRSPAEAIKALCVQIPGFERFLANAKAEGIEFTVFRGSRNLEEKELRFGGTGDIRIAPVIAGSKRAGILQTVIGVALIVASFFVAPGSQAAFLAAGIGSTAGGVIQMLSPQAKGLSQSGSPANMPSYAFGSAKNTTASGNPVPICIGRRRWGGAIISASIYAQDKA